MKIKNTKNIIRVLAMTIIFTMFSTSSASAMTISKNGFSYDTSEYNVKWFARESVTVYTDKGGKLGTMGYVVGVGRRKRTNDYILMTKEIMTPYSQKVKVNDYAYGYGLSEYVSIKTTVPGFLGEYRPKNKPSKDTYTLSMGVSSDKSASVSVGCDIEIDDLDTYIKTTSDTNTYYTVYDYIPTVLRLWKSNAYVAGESDQAGITEFETSASVLRFDIYYDARFGLAGDAQRSPISIITGYYERKTKKKSYCFPISKY